MSGGPAAGRSHSTGLPFGTRGGTLVRYTFPLDAEYVIQVRLSRQANNGATEDVPRFTDSHDLELSVDGQRVQVFTLGGEPMRQPGPRLPRVEPTRSRRELAGPSAGQGRAARHRGRRSSRRPSAVDEPLRLPFLRPIHYADGRIRSPISGKIVDHRARSRPTGPATRRAAGASSSAARRGGRRSAVRPDRFCRPSRAAPIAVRSTEADLRAADGLLQRGPGGRRLRGGHPARRSSCMLASPEFLFRVERDPGDAPPGTQPIVSAISSWRRGCRSFSGAASRTTSCSTWRSAARLREPGVLEQQVRRMLADARSQALVDQLRRAVAVPAQSAERARPIRGCFPTSTRACGRRCGARPSCSSRASCARTAACSIC